MKFEVYYTTKYSHDLVFKYCGFEECTPDFRMYPHTRSEYLIHYITKGQGTYTCEGTVYPISQGEMFAIFPNQLVSYQSSPEDPLYFYWFAFCGAKAEESAAQMGFSLDSPVRKLHPQFSVRELIHQLVERLDSIVPCHEYTVQAMLYQIMSNLAESFSLSRDTPREPRDMIFEHVEKAKSYIKCNYISPITVKDVVEHVGLERSYFSKIFHRYTGITAQKYILDVRIKHSRLLLERTNYPVKEISSYVGIKDEYYFSRAFKLSTGLSPLQYRHAFQQGGC